MVAALLASVEHSWFCLDLLETWQVHPEEQLLFCPREKNQVEGSSVAFILRLGSGTNNVHSWSAQDGKGRCLTLGGGQKNNNKKKVCSGSREDENFLKLCVHVYTFMCINMYAGGCFPVCLCVSICQCIQLPLLMENFPGEKSLSSEFKFRFHFDDAVCLAKPLRGEEGEEAEEEL